MFHGLSAALAPAFGFKNVLEEGIKEEGRVLFLFGFFYRLTCKASEFEHAYEFIAK